MNKTKRLLTTSAALAAMFLIGSLSWHKGSEAKGAYNTPVQVMNTNASPVPNLDTEKLARVPYESTASASNCPAPGNVGACFFNFAAVPAGYRLVVENLSGYFQISPAANAPLTGYVETNAFKIKTAFTAPIGQIDLGGHPQCAFDNPTRFYVDNGEGVFAVASSNWSNGASSMVLSGYLESCAVTGCPAVQH
jgi:hypothetical protein